MNRSDVYKVIFGTYILFLVIVVLCLNWLTNPSELIALGQLLFEFILFPTAIFSLALTSENIRKSTQVPALSLEWGKQIRKSQHHVSLRDIAQNENSITVPIYLNNRGNNIAVWFSISIEIPKRVYGFKDDLLLADAFDVDFGKSDNWSLDVGERYFKFVFQSNGQIASYPYQDNK